MEETYLQSTGTRLYYLTRLDNIFQRNDSKNDCFQMSTKEMTEDFDFQSSNEKFLEMYNDTNHSDRL